VYGVAPPDGFTVAVPLLFPQEALVTEVVAVGADAAVTVAEAVTVHPLLSVIVTE
jgi:hypothetical protein